MYPTISVAFLFVLINKSSLLLYKYYIVHILPTITLLRDLKHRPRNNTKVKCFTPHKKRFYDTKTWHNLRAVKLMKQPLCERCLSKGHVEPATEVHHIKPFGWAPTHDEQWKLFTDEDNLMSLCERCHKEIHKELNTQRS